MGFWRDSWRRLTLQSATPHLKFDAEPANPSGSYQPIDALFAAMFSSMGRVSREDAMSVPAVLRGRNLICSISTLPLIQYDSDWNVVRLPLLDQIDPDIANVVTLAQTVEDLLFEGVSWWRVIERGADRYPTYAQHIAFTSVRIQQEISKNSPAPLPGNYDPRRSVVYVDGVEVPWSDLIRFDSPNTPLLVSCGKSIKRAFAFDKAAEMYANNPRPLDYFTPKENAEDPTDDEARGMLDDWTTARHANATAYIKRAVDYHSVDSPSPADLQLVELQKKVTLDLAVALGLDPTDLGVSVTTNTYQNVTDRRQDRINNTLSPYMQAITQRLSMGDVTKRGYTVAFDLDDYMRADPVTRWSTYQTAKNLGAITVEEIRREEKLPPLPEGAAEPTPQDTPQEQQQQQTDQIPDNVRQMRPRVAAGLEDLTTFDADIERSLTLDFPVETFGVDFEKRTIEGIVVPYGPDKIATKNGRRWRFAQGALTYDDMSRVKLLRDHDFSQPLGPMVYTDERPQGRFARYRVGTGEDGDRALREADEGVRDGFSPGVDIIQYTADPLNKGVLLVTRAAWRETSVLALPAFDDARVTKVAASRDLGEPMDPCTTCGQNHAPGVACTAPAPTPAPVAPAPAPDMQAMFASFMQDYLGNARPTPALPLPDEGPSVVNPTRTTTLTAVREPSPYRFDRGGNFQPGAFVFSTDLLEMSRVNDVYGTNTDAGRRVMGLLQETFSTVVTTDVNELNPDIQRPDMYVDQRDLPTPLWNMISRGVPPNGVQPFVFPKFSSSSGLVGDHTEGTEPTAGTFVTTSQTVTPTALSGKASITREVWDMGGNPAVSTLIFNQMVRGYREGLETAAGTFLNTLTAATDINLGVAVVDSALQAAWNSALADLQFNVRSYDFSAFALEKWLYKAFVAAKDSDGRLLYPIINPMNAAGAASSRFRQLDLAGVVGIPTGALTAVSGSANNSWLFDPAVVWGWATTPQRLEFPGTPSAGGYAPVAMVDLAIWGYKAFANTDIGGVRQVIYDNA